MTPVEDSRSVAPVWRDLWLMMLSRTMVLNGAIAVVLTVFDLTPGPTLANFVYSYCIGTLVTVGIMVPRQILLPSRQPTPGEMTLLAVFGAAFGLIVGRVLAAMLLRQPFDFESVFSDHSFRISLIFAIIGSFGGTVYFWQRERGAVLREQQAFEREHRETVSRQLAQTQLQLLRAQVDPHMLFNTLANLRALIRVDPLAAQRMLDRLIDFFRASLAASKSEWSSCEREFRLAEDYLELIAIRMGERLRYSLSLPAELRGARIPSMILQPLIENAIKHGLEPHVDGGEVRVQARADGDMLELSVCDTGVGIDPAAHKPSREYGQHQGGQLQGGLREGAQHDGGQHDGGFGTAQVRERLQTLFQDRAGFALKPVQPHGALASIRLPLLPAAQASTDAAATAAGPAADAGTSATIRSS